MQLALGPWDLVLIAVASLQATALAYLRHPRWKALLISLPLPFTVASLAVGQRIGITNVVGLLLLLGFTQGVRILRQNLRVPIVPAIVFSALGYCLIGGVLMPLLPKSDTAFYLTSALLLVFAFALLARLPHRAEPGHRTPLPIWIELPIVAGVILLLVASKQILGGFITVFPMVGVIAAYEARHSLWTLGRQIPALMIAMIPLMVTSHLTYPLVGLGPSLALGWIVFLGILAPLTWLMWRRPRLGAPQPTA